VRSRLRARATFVSRCQHRNPVAVAAGGGSRGGRSKRKPWMAPVSAPVQVLAVPASPVKAAGALCSVNRSVAARNPELVAVPMEEEQELVYGWLGLKPPLFARSQPQCANTDWCASFRPGEDPEARARSGRQQPISTASRRRTRSRWTGAMAITTAPITAVVLMTGTAINGSGDNWCQAGQCQTGHCCQSTLVRHEPSLTCWVEISPFPGPDEPMATVTNRDSKAPVVQVPAHAQDHPFTPLGQPLKAGSETSAFAGQTASGSLAGDDSAGRKLQRKQQPKPAPELAGRW